MQLLKRQTRWCVLYHIPAEGRVDAYYASPGTAANEAFSTGAEIAAKAGGDILGLVKSQHVPLVLSSMMLELSMPQQRRH